MSLELILLYAAAAMMWFSLACRQIRNSAVRSEKLRGLTAAAAAVFLIVISVLASISRGNADFGREGNLIVNALVNFSLFGGLFTLINMRLPVPPIHACAQVSGIASFCICAFLSLALVSYIDRVRLVDFLLVQITLAQTATASAICILHNKYMLERDKR